MVDQCPANFVRVASDGSRFEVNGSPFYFSGANCYYIMVSMTCQPSMFLVHLPRNIQAKLH